MMQSPTMQPSAKPMHENKPVGLDAFVKLLAGIVLTIIPFMIESRLSFIVLGIVLILIAVIFKIRLRTLLLSAASYGVIVVFPYVFGIVISGIVNFLTGSLFYNAGTQDSLLRLLKLFVIWYVSILYFQTTPMPTVLGLLDKLLSPLKWIGVPIQDYLKVVMCIVIELKEAGSEIKNKFMKNARSAIRSNPARLHDKFRAVSQIIVSSLVDSFDKLERIQCFVENVKPRDLYHYTFKLSLKELAALLFIIGLISVLYVFESGVIA